MLNLIKKIFKNNQEIWKVNNSIQFERVWNWYWKYKNINTGEDLFEWKKVVDYKTKIDYSKPYNIKVEYKTEWTNVYKELENNFKNFIKL